MFNRLSIPTICTCCSVAASTIFAADRLAYPALKDGACARHGAILCFCAITALFAALSFGSLAVIQCLLYAAALTLEFLALIVLRIRRPEVRRSFRVPGGWWGMSYVCVTPFAFVALVLLATLRDWRSFPRQLLVVGVVVLSAVALYFSRRRIALQRSVERSESVASPPSVLS